MKYAWMSLIMGLVLGLIGGYMLVSVVNPLSEERLNELVDVKELKDVDQVYAEIRTLKLQGIIQNYLNPQRLILVSAIWLSSVFCIALFVHASTDKFFFKEFFRPPNYRVAIRRSFLFTAAVAVLIYLRVNGVEVWVAILPVLLIIILELIIHNIKHYRRGKKVAAQNPPVTENQDETADLASSPKT